MEHPDSLHVEIAAKPKKRTRARHRARGGKANAKVVEDMGTEAETNSLVRNEPARPLNTSNRRRRARAAALPRGGPRRLRSRRVLREAL